MTLHITWVEPPGVLAGTPVVALGLYFAVVLAFRPAKRRTVAELAPFDLVAVIAVGAITHGNGCQLARDGPGRRGRSVRRPLDGVEGQARARRPGACVGSAGSSAAPLPSSSSTATSGTQRCGGQD